MRINRLKKPEFLNLIRESKAEFLNRIHFPELFIIEGFYEKNEILNLRSRIHSASLKSDPSWHPLKEGCPDYHRLHDNYPGAHVKSKMHGHYFHGWYAHNNALFEKFREIFEIKAWLGNFDEKSYLNSTPSAGPIARVNFQNYPKGGGHISEHLDPNSSFALIQTLIQASTYNDDFKKGGLYARTAPGAEKFYIDQHTNIGDLIVLSPAIPHGVDPIDPESNYNWLENSGKWTILPLIVAPDYDDKSYSKPREI